MLNKTSQRRVIDATRQAERNGRGKPPAARGPAILTPSKYARVTTAIKPATSAGPGHGKGDLLLVLYAPDGSARWDTVPQARGVDLYSIDDVGTTVGTVVALTLVDGRYHVFVEKCGSSPSNGTGTNPGTGTGTTPTTNGLTASGFDPPGFTPPGF